MHTFSLNGASKTKRMKIGELCLVVVIIVFSLIVLAVIVAIMIEVQEMEVGNHKKACMTTGCIHAASKILDTVDFDVEPCVDFYQYSCANYLRTHDIEDNFSNNVQYRLKSLIEEPLVQRVPRPFRLLKNLYSLCMDRNASEVHGLLTIKSMIENMGGWPILDGDSWNEGAFDWKQIMYKFRKLGFSNNYFIDFDVRIDDKNSSRYIITLDEASLGLNRELLIKGLNEKLVKLYYEYMVDIAVVFGANETDAIKQYQDALEFEVQLAMMSLPSEHRRNATALYNPMTIEELQYSYPGTSWLEYINNIFDIPDIKITYDEVVNVRTPKFIENLNNLLRRTTKRIQANYAIMRAIVSSIPQLNEELRNRRFKYIENLGNSKKKESRWEECTRITSRSIHLAAESLYIDKYGNNEYKTRVDEIVGEIKNVFADFLKTVDWMDEITKGRALQKISSVRARIGYPDELLDVKQLEKFYTNLEIIPGNYFKTMNAIKLFNDDVNYMKLRTNVNRSNWIDNYRPLEAGGFYSFSRNTIELPEIILQDRFFNDHRPNYINYAQLGVLVAQELFRGFDNTGRYFDKDGNRNDWWTNETESAFVKKRQCAIETDKNLSVDSVEEEDEEGEGGDANTDGVVKVVYAAYTNWIVKNGHEKKLPGLNLTSKQIFWIFAAQTLCFDKRGEIKNYFNKAKRHKLETINSKYFVDNFNCHFTEKNDS